MIQWRPGQYSYWTAGNIQNVNSTGAESSLSLDYVHNNVRAGMRAGYSYTRAMAEGSGSENDPSAGKQLMYIPENKANALFNAGYKNIYFSWIASFTGKRYITVENSKYLSGYFINNLSTGTKLTLKSTSIDLNFSIDNLFNIYYQSIAYFPLPGRSFLFKIVFQIVK
jgi:iron complex outermembrane receptor protein